MVADTLKASYAIALFFDIAGAFDNVMWPTVLKALKDRCCSRNLYAVMQYFSDRTVDLTWGSETVTKRATRGCSQGSILGPTCWDHFDELLKILENLDNVSNEERR